MEEAGIGMVLARASELRSKITSCIDEASITPHPVDNAILPEAEREGQDEVSARPSGSSPSPHQSRDAEEDENVHTLLSIRDALESLEALLSSLQALQQQQQYEREAALAEIDYSRKILLGKLKEYNGRDLEVINEASAFASETVQHNNDLLLPPYPSRHPQSLMLDKGFLSHFPSSQKFVQNRSITSDPTNEAKKNLSEIDCDELPTASRNSLNRIGHFMTGVAKMVITLVGVVSVLNLAGFEPWLTKRDSHFKFLGVLRQSAAEKRRSTTAECPPGKVLVMEDGEARCLVKERVEIPFESLVAKPDVNYGFG